MIHKDKGPSCLSQICLKKFHIKLFLFYSFVFTNISRSCVSNSMFSCCRRLVQRRKAAALIPAQTRDVQACLIGEVTVSVFFVLSSISVSVLGTKIQGTLLKRPSWAAAAVSCLVTPHPCQLPVLCSLLPHPSAPTACETDIQVVSFTDHTFSRWFRLLTKTKFHHWGGCRCPCCSWSDQPPQKSSLFTLFYNIRHDLNVQSIFLHKPSS